jgi:hypothetical protein
MTTRQLIKDLEKYNSRDLLTLQKFYKLPKMPKTLLVQKIAKLNLERIKTATMPYGDCSNQVELFSQDDWSAENEPSIKVTFWWYKDFSKKQNIQCYDRDNLKQWLATPEHTLYKWIANTRSGVIDPMGYGGGPSNSFTVQNWPDSQFVLKTNLQAQSENINAYPIAKNMRIGREFGISQNHGQLPGFVVYELSLDQDPKTFYLSKIHKELFDNVNVNECLRNYQEYTPEQLFLIVDSISETNPKKCYDNNTRVIPQAPEPVQQIQEQSGQVQQVQEPQESDDEEDEELPAFEIEEIELEKFDSVPDNELGDPFYVSANDYLNVTCYDNYTLIVENQTNNEIFIKNPTENTTFCKQSADNTGIILIPSPDYVIIYNYIDDSSIKVIIPVISVQNIQYIKSTSEEEDLLFLQSESKIIILGILENSITSTKIVNVPYPVRKFVAQPTNVLDIFYHDRTLNAICCKRTNHKGQDIFTKHFIGVTSISACNYEGTSVCITVFYSGNIRRVIAQTLDLARQVEESIIGTQRVQGQLFSYGENKFIYKSQVYNLPTEVIYASAYLENTQTMRVNYIDGDDMLHSLSFPLI